MPLIINTNVQSLNSQRQLVKSGMEMSTAMERLSSGKRINGAGDDAAGLAIASRMTSQVRGLTQAVRNANDGISLIQTAGGALEESTNILQRMRELAIQSANGIYTDANRTSLNAELDQLKSELTRIAETTSFNGLRILDGTLGEIALQVGSEANQTIGINIGSGFDAESLGASDTTTGTGSYTLSESTNAVQSGDPSSLNSLSDGDLVINGVAVPGAESYDTVSTSDNGASALAISEAINSVSDQTGVVATASNSVNAGTLEVTSWVDLGALTLDAGGVVIAAGEFYVDGIEITGTFSADNETFITELNTALAASDVSFSTDGTNIFVTKTDGSDVSIISTGALASSDTLTFGGDAFGGGALETLDTIAGTTLAAGDLSINGQAITGTVKSSSDLVNLINTQTTNTGVTASVNGSNELVLTSVDGRNIQLTTDGSIAASGDYTAGITTSIVDMAAAGDTTYSGTVVMTGSSIELSGNDTSGFTTSEVVSALQTTAGTTSSMTLDFVGAAATGATTNNFTLNGTSIAYTVDPTDTDFDTAAEQAALFASTINAFTDQTGVTASINGTEVTLATGLGNNISLTTTDTASANAPDIDITATTGTATLTGTGADIFDKANDNSGNVGAHSVVDAGTDATFTAPTNGDLTINGYTVDFDGFTTSDANEKSTVAGESSAMFIAAAINSTSGLNDEVIATAMTTMNLGEVKEADVEDQFTLIVNGLVVDIDGPVLIGDSNSNISGTLNAAFADAANTNSGIPGAGETHDAAGLIASVNENGELIITAEDGRNITVSLGGSPNGAGLFANFDVTEAGSVTSKGSVALTAQDGFKIGDIAGDNPGLAGIEASQDGIASIDISTQNGAQEAIEVVDRALEDINNAIGALGAANNRLDFTVSNLASVSENSSAARSRIMDADFAAETSMLSRAQVLQQASQAMLAQANALPQQVLRLLQ